jgi:hypothetical protein
MFSVETISFGFGQNSDMKEAPGLTEDPIAISPRSRFRAAMILAMAADALQIFVFPLFVEGVLSPADDVLDLAVAAGLVHLLGCHRVPRGSSFHSPRATNKFLGLGASVS